MGNQVSETHDRYNNSAGVRQKYHFDDAAGLGLPQPFLLHDHHVEGPSKVCTQLNPFIRLCLRGIERHSRNDLFKCSFA